MNPSFWANGIPPVRMNTSFWANGIPPVRMNTSFRANGIPPVRMNTSFCQDTMMGSKDNQTRIDGGDVDRLSSLSDDLIHKIFSSISTKHVVQASVCSSRWRFIWTSMPYLNLSTQDFSTSPKFSEFLTHFLSCRNKNIDVSSVKLNLNFSLEVSQEFVKEITDYAFSRNIQQLDLSVNLISACDREFTLSLFSCFPSLKYLSFSNALDCSSDSFYQSRLKCTTSRFELPALTTLYLQHVKFCKDDNDGLFSKCVNLKNLVLERCLMVESKKFSICHPQLSNLTLDNSFFGQFGKVVAPKLENLTITNWRTRKMDYFIEIYAPDLTSIVYKGRYLNSVRLSKDGFTSLKEADIHVSKPRYEHILCLLKHIHNVKFLTLNMDFLEGLSSCMEEIIHQPFVFTNLKRLKIRPQSGSLQCYYLNSYPGATLEEIVVSYMQIVAQSLVLEFSVLLEQENTMTRVERGKGPMENRGTKMHGQGKSQAETKLKIGESVAAKIDICLERLRVQIEQKKSRYHLIISKLQKIEEVLAKLPASKTALIQPSLASLSAEAVIVMGEITDLMRTQYDEKESQISAACKNLLQHGDPSY